MRTTRAVVMVGMIPHRIFRDRERARDYLDGIDDDRLEDVRIVWPVEVGDRS